MNGKLDGIPNDIVKGHPLLELHKERVDEISQVIQFRSECPHPYVTFNFPTNPDGEQGPPSPGRGDRPGKTEQPKLPRLTLTHADNTQYTQPLRLAAAIGKVGA